MTPARAAEVLRRMAPGMECCRMGADALELLAWLFATISPWGSIRVHELYRDWHGEDSFLDYARAEWEKERRK